MIATNRGRRGSLAKPIEDPPFTLPMSEVRLWKCDLTANALTSVKEALEAANIPISMGEKVIVTYRLYQRVSDEEGEDEFIERSILLGKISTEPERCWIIGGEGGCFVTTSEMESLITKLHDGSIKLRQTVTFEVTNIIVYF